MPHTLIPTWVYLTFEIVAALTTFGAFLVYVALFPWWHSAIGRHRFTLYLSILVAEVLTLVGIFIGYYRGALIAGSAVWAFISSVMVWAMVQMLRKQPNELNRKNGHKPKDDH